jgi:integrase
MAVIEKRVARDGTTHFRAKVRMKGHRPMSKTFPRKTDAQAWASDVEQRIRRGEVYTSAELETLAGLIDRYVAQELPKKPQGQKDVKRHLDWWRQAYGHLFLRDVTPAVLAEGRDTLLQEPPGAGNGQRAGEAGRTKTPATVTRYMAHLSHVFTVAVQEWEWLSANPMSKVRKPQAANARVRFLDDAEREQLLGACRNSPCPFLYPVVVIALSTGARYSEVVNLRWKDIDLERGIARLEHTKNRDRRALPLTHHALDVVRELHRNHKRRDTDLLFPRADGQAPMEIRKHWNRAVKEAGIQDFRFHDLRHTAASYLAMNGATLAEIADVLGHRTLQMVKRYAHLSDQHTASVVERMNRQMFGG